MDDLRRHLEKHNQLHLLQFLDRLNDEQRTHLIHQISKIDFDHVKRLFEQTQADSHQAAVAIDKLMKPVPNDVFGGTNRNALDEIEKFYKEGLQAISRGEVAVVLLAGGQGTRLGVDYPKGMYDVGLPSHKTLYQIQAERILRLEHLAKDLTGHAGQIPWYIMTSEATKHSTQQFFATHGFFGLNPSSLVLFEQAMLPCFDFEGKVILESPDKIAVAPGGNGGIYSALVRDGILDDFKKRGVKFVHVFGVDNILVRVADPYFVGFCISKGADCGNKVVEKTHPDEPVGVVCLVNGVWQVVEYSEINPETARLRNPDESLMFNAGNIANHFYTVDFLDEVCRNQEPMLKYHIAKKKIPHVDLTTGNLIKPTKPNGIKMEKFVFDVFQFSKRFVVWEAIRKDEFAPLKNSDSAPDDNPKTCKRAIYDLHRRFIEKAGGKIIGAEGKELVCEISPLVSYAGEGLTGLVNGRELVSPVLLESANGSS